MEQQERSKMLGTMPMGRLVPKVSVPIMVSMLVQALYNIVDGIFVARYSPNALTAVSLAFPIQLLMIAVATGLGVGINSLISRKLGQKRAEEAREAALDDVQRERESEKQEAEVHQQHRHRDDCQRRILRGQGHDEQLGRPRVGGQGQ